ncbi:MAG: M48 family metalloprotease [Magnetococcales bacterium]|nr:M48 family metalloprotease [Magnetococcales bacterium]
MNGLKTTLLLAGLVILFTLVGHAVAGVEGMVAALLAALAINFFSWWFSDRLLLSLYQAEEIGPNEAPEFYMIVEDLAHQAGIPIPRVYIINDPVPNAFATGRNPDHAAVAATVGLLHTLDQQQLTAVMAHEIGHILHRDTLIATLSAVMVGALTSITHVASSSSHRHQSWLLMIIAPVAALIIQMAISRQREYGADEAAARLSGEPLWLASALEQLSIANQQQPLQKAIDYPATASLFIVNPLTGHVSHFLDQLFSTHPPMEKRIRRLQMMADL